MSGGRGATFFRCDPGYHESCVMAFRSTSFRAYRPADECIPVSMNTTTNDVDGVLNLVVKRSGSLGSVKLENAKRVNLLELWQTIELGDVDLWQTISG